MAARFVLILSPAFLRDLDRLPARDHGLVLRTLEILETNPTGPHPKVKKLKGKAAGLWRLEVWPYRIRYDVVGREVHLHRVRDRKEIYRD